MATLPTFVKRSEVWYPTRRKEDIQEDRRVRVDDPYFLRPLPGEDIFFYAKLIDNARVVRQADPRARGACWSAAGVMCLLAALLVFSLFPRVANVLAGYKVEALRQEQQRLIDERQVLEVDEAKLLRLDRLEELAQHQNLAPPKPGQIFDLEPKGDGSMASLAGGSSSK
jgi:hypothetical protein